MSIEKCGEEYSDRTGETLASPPPHVGRRYCNQDFSRAHLIGKFVGVNFNCSKFRNARITGEFIDVKFTCADLQGAIFTGASLKNVSFQEAINFDVTQLQGVKEAENVTLPDGRKYK